jgi:lipopolysaccharide export system permease protein
MKIIFTYLSLSLLRAFVFSVAAFVFCMLIVDLFGSLDDLIKNKAGIVFILKYYAVQLPVMAQFVLPIAFMFSSLYVLAYMSQHREIICLHGAGLSLPVIAIPFFLLAILNSAALYWFFVDWAPTSQAHREDLEAELKGQQTAETRLTGIVYRNPETGAVWYMQEVNVATGTFHHGEIVLKDKMGRDGSKLFVAQGTWKDGYWDLAEVRQITYRSNGTATDPVDYSQMDAKELTTPPKDLVTVHREPRELTWGELSKLIHSPYLLPSRKLARYQVEYYYRQAFPLMPIVLCFFALAIGASHSRRNIAASVFNCVFFLLGFMIWMSMSRALGNGGRISPAFAAWNAILVFGLAGVVFFAYRAGWIWELRMALRPARPMPRPS